MTLPDPPQRYEQAAETERNRAIINADVSNLKRQQDIEMTRARLILRSPDGHRWNVTVNNAGVLAAVLLS